MDCMRVTALGTFCLSAGSMSDSTELEFMCGSWTRCNQRWFLFTMDLLTKIPSLVRRRVAKPELHLTNVNCHATSRHTFEDMFRIACHRCIVSSL